MSRKDYIAEVTVSVFAPRQPLGFSLEVTEVEPIPVFPDHKIYYFEGPDGERSAPYKIVSEIPGTDPETGEATLELSFERIDGPAA